MNISEFERLLRENTPEFPFPPEADRWLKLERELRQRKTRTLPVIFRWSAAAAVLLLIATGLYRFINVPAEKYPASVRLNKMDRPHIIPQPVDPVPPSQIPANPPRERPVQAVIAAKTTLNKMPPEPDTPGGDIKPAPVPAVNTQSDAEFPIVQQSPPQRQAPDREDPEPLRFQTAPRDRKIQLGITALYGMSDISKGQYRLALEGRRNLSARVFANMQLMAAAATIASNTDYRYQSITLDPPGTAVPSMAVQTASAQYRGSVYTLGFSPGIGIQLTKKLALSVGPDVQKRLGGALSLSNREEFRNPINNRSLIDERKQVADVDFGMQSAARMNLNSNLAFTLLYRYGLTDYLKTVDGTVRNSFFSLGLSYRFIH